MSNRDDFPQAVKVVIAQRAGFRCSFPTCCITTVGPSEETETSIAHSGMACHISAASPGVGARRYRPDMTSEERKSASNGIWMCYTHGKLIDTDENRFTIERLKKWKEIAEFRAQFIHEHGDKITINPIDIQHITLPSLTIKLNGLGIENITIGEAIDDSCMCQIWGEDTANSIRDVAIEVCRNAFTHGNATLFELIIEPDRLRLIDNGNEFNLQDLLDSENKSGGSLSLRNLANNNSIILISDRDKNNNQYTFSYITDGSQILKLTPCAIKFDNITILRRKIPFEIYKPCKEIFIIVSRYVSYSDIFLFKKLIIDLKINEDKITIAISASCGVTKEFREAYPNARVIII